MATVYDIAVKLGVSSNHKEVLGSLLGMLGTTEQAVQKLVASLGGMKGVLMGVGGALAFAGGVKAAGVLITHGDTLLHQQALMMTAGMSQKEIAEATARAWQTSQDVLGSNIAENMQSLRELRGVFGDTKEAGEHLAELTRAQLVIGSMLPQHNAAEDVFNFAKALEIKGVSMDPAHFDKLLNEMVQASLAMGGKINGADFLSAMKYGRTATLGWSDEFVGTILPTLMQEMKGGGGFGGATGPGNALMSAFQEIVGGTMSNKVATELLKMGLLDPRKVITTKTGSVKGVKPGGVTGSAEFAADPYKWTQDVLVPALRAHGIITDDAMRAEISHLFGVRTAQQIISMFATQQQRFTKDAALDRGAQNVDTAKATLDAHDPTMVMKAFTEAWSNLLTALGEPLARGAIPIMQSMTSGLNALNRAALDHPEIGKYLEAIGIGVAAWGGITAVIKVTTAIRGLFALLAGAEVITAAAGATAVAGGLSAVTGVAGLAAAGPSLMAVAGGLAALIGAAAGVKALLDLGSGKIDQLLMGRTTAEQDAKTKLLDKMHQGGWEQFKGWLGLDSGHAAPATMPPTGGNEDSSHVSPHLWHRSSAVLPPNRGNSITVTLDGRVPIQMDGRTVAMLVADRIAAHGSLPQGGSSAFDGTMSSPSPGQQVRA